MGLINNLDVLLPRVPCPSPTPRAHTFLPLLWVPGHKQKCPKCARERACVTCFPQETSFSSRKAPVRWMNCQLSFKEREGWAWGRLGDSPSVLELGRHGAGRRPGRGWLPDHLPTAPPDGLCFLPAVCGEPGSMSLAPVQLEVV